jgi:hypothetical protein
MSSQALLLQEAFSNIDDFRHPQGKRYKLQAVLVLTCLAIMHGAKSEEDVARWGEGEGRKWLRLLGMRQHRCPSQATIQRIFRGVDRSQLDAALNQWTQNNLSETGSVMMKSQDKLGVEDDEHKSFGRDQEENSLNVLSQWISEAGLKIWGVDYEEMNQNKI